MATVQANMTQRISAAANRCIFTKNRFYFFTWCQTQDYQIKISHNKLNYLFELKSNFSHFMIEYTQEKKFQQANKCDSHQTK